MQNETAKTDVPKEDADLIPDGQTVSPSAGLAWLADGFKLFMANRHAWLLLALVWLIILLVLNAIPYLGSVLLIVLQPIFLAGAYRVCRQQEDGEAVDVRDLFAGFHRPANALWVLGGLNLALYVALGLVAILLSLLFFGEVPWFAHHAEDVRAITQLSYGPMLVFTIVMLVVGFVVLSAAFFSPALVLLNGLTPIAAMRMSCLGVLKNWLAVLVMGVVASAALLLVILIAMLPAALLGSIWFLLSYLPVLAVLVLALPTFMAASYASYRHIYLNRYVALKT